MARGASALRSGHATPAEAQDSDEKGTKMSTTRPERQHTNGLGALGAGILALIWIAWDRMLRRAITTEEES